MFKAIFISLSWILLLFKVQSDKQIDLAPKDLSRHLAISCLPSNRTTHCNCTVQHQSTMKKHTRLLPKHPSKGCRAMNQLLFNKVTNLLSSKKRNVEKKSSIQPNHQLTLQPTCNFHGEVPYTVLGYVGEETILRVASFRNGYRSFDTIPGAFYKVFYDHDLDERHSGEVAFAKYNQSDGSLTFLPTRKDTGLLLLSLKTYFHNCTTTSYSFSFVTSFNPITGYDDQSFIERLIPLPAETTDILMNIIFLEFILVILSILPCAVCCRYCCGNNPLCPIDYQQAGPLFFCSDCCTNNRLTNHDYFVRKYRIRYQFGRDAYQDFLFKKASLKHDKATGVISLKYNDENPTTI